MIQTRRAQRTFGDGLIAEEVKDLHEEWMKHADQVLGDKEIVAAIYEALAKRHPQSRTRGRPGTPAEVVLRLLVLKHMRNWSYGVLEGEARAQSSKAKRGLPQIAECDRPGCGPGEALRQRDRRRRQACPWPRTGVVRQHPAPGGAGGSAPDARKDGAACPAGDAPNHSTRLRRRHPCRG